MAVEGRALPSGRGSARFKLSGATAAGVLCLLTLTAVPARAWADTSSDGRASFTDGNVTTCSAVGFPGDIFSDSTDTASGVTGTVEPNSGSLQPGKGQEVDVTVSGSSVVVDAVVVKGGNGFNLYRQAAYLPPQVPPKEHYVPPLDPGGNVPTVGHWFLCYHVGPLPALPEAPLAVVMPILAAAVLGVSVVGRRRAGPR